MQLTSALHTYLRVADVAAARVVGLLGCSYLDNLHGRERREDGAPEVAFDSEVDRIYLATPPTLQLREGGRTVVIAKAGFPDAVVWNPWIAKAASMADFGDDEFRSMVCVEPAAIAVPVIIQPGAEWVATQELMSVLS